MNKAVIFDMDGVIFDSEKAILEVWMEYAKMKNWDNFDVVYPKTIGVNEMYATNVFKEAYGLDFPFMESYTEVKRIYHEKYDGGKLPLKSGVEETLTILKEKGFKLGLASSSLIKDVTQELKDAKLYDYFDVVMGGDMIEHSKPDPEIFLKTAKSLGCEPDKCFVVEDSYNGVRAGFAGGFKTIMVPDLLPPTDETKEKATVILEDLTEAGKYILGE